MLYGSVGTKVSEERSASIIKGIRIGELGTMAITSNRCMLQLLVMANIVPSSPILATLMMEALCSSKMSVLTRDRQHNISEDGILQSLP
jgi:cobalamin synthase